MAAATGAAWTTAWVIGASSGLGREIARQLAARGVSVAASARRADALEVLTRDSGGAIRPYPLDIVDTSAVRAVADRIEQDLGTPDLVVQAAAVWHPFRLDDVSADSFERSMQVNYLGSVNVVAAVLPRMRQADRGTIALIASVAGYRGLPKAAIYAPTKAALISLAECLHTELDGSGVSVRIVNPGFIATPMTARNDFPMPFLMQPDEAARRTIDGLAGRGFETAYPRRFVAVLKLMRLLPYSLYFPIIRKLVSRR
ncbi:short-subunit dehydrogenase [Tepidamorphus gemmatus]|uniref:Short-subunit dehydrogenase n=1 Tax=Tepidamorphus gemmatus TaxID=747076 RepID=A0A4R3M9L5_9HYPH|nr:SDR family NAD(P)-dependent oxidoreductase [Tepidamorphus gemmatus]TCT09303.1 short-subunit dehydrogenase [Tepidamorphus gemmatus]